MVSTAVVGMALLGACGGSTTDSATDSSDTTATTVSAKDQRNRRQVEQFVLDLQKKGSPELNVANPSCPEKIDVTGTSFECTVEIEGLRAPYTVRFPTSERIDAAPAKPIIGTAKLVDLIKGKLSPSSASAKVDCGAAPVRVTEVGATFPCTVSDGSDTQTVKVQVKDLMGTVAFQT